MRRFFRSLVIVTLVASPVVWLGGYFAATRTHAYSAAVEIIEGSTLVNDYVGGVDSYRLTLFDGFRYSTFGTEAEARFRLRVTGSQRTAIVYLRLERQAERWKLVEGNLVDEQGRVESLMPDSPDP